jgi:hypothetical protein
MEYIIIKDRFMQPFISYPYKFVIRDGYIPVSRIVSEVYGNENYFQLKQNLDSYGSPVDFFYNYDSTRRLVHGAFSMVIVYAGFSNFIVINEIDFDTVNKGITNPNFMIDLPYPDILHLSVVRIEDIRKIKFHITKKRNDRITIPDEILVVLTSQEYVDERYMDKFGVRAARDFNSTLSDRLRGIERRNVPKSYIDSFFIPKVKIETNSLSELKTIEERILNTVF